MAKPDVLDEFDVRDLNTIVCVATNEWFQDLGFMTCTVHGRGRKIVKTIDRVVTVEGRIRVLPSSEKGTIFVKTSPWIGMPAHITVKPHSPTNGKVINVEPRGHPLL